MSDGAHYMANEKKPDRKLSDFNRYYIKLVILSKFVLRSDKLVIFPAWDVPAEDYMDAVTELRMEPNGKLIITTILQ